MNHLILLTALCCFVTASYSQSAASSLQDTTTHTTLSSKYLASISNSAGKLDRKLDKRMVRELRRWKKQEAKLQRKLAHTDSTKAKQVFGDACEQYAALDQRLSRATNLQQYVPDLDTLGTSLKFLQQHPNWLPAGATDKLNEATGKLKGLEGKLQQAEELKKFLKERKQFLTDQLQNSGLARQFKQLNRQVYYFNEQLSAYKSLLKDRKKAEQKALALLRNSKFFQDFLRRNSKLASLFRLPGDPNDPISQASLAGLQTRAQVNGLIQQQIAAGGPNAAAQLQQNLQGAQAQLMQLKNKIGSYGKSSSDDILPEGFKPNGQKTKSFLQRIELGTNFQSQKASGFFPTTSDVGLSIGYKLNDKSIVGIGGSYKIGWGESIHHIHITGQGYGLRSFIDWKIKGSFWLSGGYELNYRPVLATITVSTPSGPTGTLSAWQRSALVGVSKTIPVKTKFFKNTKLQLLWDVLSYGQEPRTQPIVFRTGYGF